MHGLDVAVDVQSGSLGGQEFRAEVLRLLAHGLGERAAGGAADARIVHDFVGDGDLPAEIILFEDEHTVAGTGKVQARGQACGAAADDDDVIEIVGLSHRKLLTAKGAPSERELASASETEGEAAT